LQVPSVPQEDEACAEHSLSGSSDTEMAPQTPSLPAPFLAAVQAWQSPVQPVSQQTESTHEPEAHWLAAEHAPPLPTLPEHFPPEQNPEVQSASTEHVVLHAALPHTKGAHALAAPAMQLPEPLHVAAAV